MHEEWDICFYQELTRVPSLPFGWSSGKLPPKVFSSVLPSRDEGACIVISARLSPYVFDIPSPSPGALCTALLHFPGLPPVLLVSVYAQPPRRPELEKSLNGLFAKYPMYLMGGDFNAQFSSLDTNGVTDNRWRWLSSLIDKTEAVDKFRAKHPGARAYTRYRSAFLNCDTRIDFILCSTQLLSTLSLRLLQASIHDHDQTSDHHPISCVIGPRNTPSYPPPPTRHAHFRRLTQEEQIDFLSHIEPLERWAATLDLSQVPDAQFCSYLDSLVEQIGVAFHRTTNPMKPHKETKLEREYKSVLSSISDNTASRKRALIKLQELNQKWTKKIATRQKKQLHYSLVKGSKIKQAIERALKPCQKSPIQLWDKSTDPPRLATDPEHVGRVFSECLPKLG